MQVMKHITNDYTNDDTNGLGRNDTTNLSGQIWNDCDTIQVTMIQMMIQMMIKNDKKPVQADLEESE